MVEHIESRWNCAMLLSNQRVYFQQKQGVLGVTLTMISCSQTANMHYRNRQLCRVP
jgi:hypothetical protein